MDAAEIVMNIYSLMQQYNVHCQLFIVKFNIMTTCDTNLSNNAAFTSTVLQRMYLLAASSTVLPSVLYTSTIERLYNYKYKKILV